MDQSACITNTQWQQYAEGTLDKHQLVLLNTHVETCVICADIKDGLDAMVNKSTLANHIETIHQSVDKQVALTTKTISLRTWLSVAAAIVLLAAVSVAVYQQKQSSIIETAKVNQPIGLYPDSTQKEIKTNEVEPKQLAVAGKAKSTKNKIRPKVNRSQPQQIEQQPMVSSDASVVEDIKPAATEEKDLAEPLEEVAAVKKLTNAESVVSREITSTPKRKASSKTPQPSATYPSNYNAASNTTLSSVEFVDTNWVYLAKTYFNKQQWDSCLLISQSYLSHSNNTTKEFALYWTALAQVKLGNTSLAKQYLKQCIDLKGDLRKEAKQELEKLP